MRRLISRRSRRSTPHPKHHFDRLEDRILLHAAAWSQLFQDDSFRHDPPHERDPADTLDVAAELAAHLDAANGQAGRAARVANEFQPNPSSAQIGQWEPVFAWPHVAVHMNLLPTGQVMTWSRSGDDSLDIADSRLWDPATNQFTSRVDNPYNLFCAGHAFLSDGRLMTAGGHTVPDGYLQLGYGIESAGIYDPWTAAWSVVPNMAGRRWYPTSLTLASGDVLVMAGEVEPGVTYAIPEVWSGGAWRSLTNAPVPFTYPWYPWLYEGPDGRVFFAGPDQGTHYLNVAGAGDWDAVGDRVAFGSRAEGGSIEYTPGKIMVVGGGGRGGGQLPTATSETIDLNSANPQWSTSGAMQFPRRQHSVTMLPDGTVLVTGGTSASGWNAAGGAVLAAERWNPATGLWSTLANMSDFRGYHATTMLLPDGRVLTAGGEGGGIARRTAQLFSPPYLFAPDGTDAIRPSITSAPTEIKFGRSFDIQTTDPSTLGLVTLVGLSSVTHWFNSGQHYAELSFQATATGATVAAPPHGLVVPAGYYMLFVLDTLGVPSVARIVRLGDEPQAVPGFAVRAGQAGSNPSDEARAVVVDAAGNSYVAGSVMFADGNSDTAGSGTGDIFIARYRPDGSVAWLHTFGGSGNDRALAITLDASGHVYVAGSFSDTVDFDPSAGVLSLTSAGGLDIFLLKLDLTGLLVAANRFGGVGHDVAYALDVDAADAVYVAGQFAGTVPFGSTAVLTAAGNTDALVLKQSAAGAIDWVVQFGGASADRATAIDVDFSGQVLVAGSFRGTVDFDPGPGVTKHKSAGGSDVFLARLAASGGLVWARRMGGSQSDEPHGVRIDSDGSVFVTGYFRSTATFDLAGPSGILASAGDTDVFIVKLDPAGQFVWARRFGGTGSDRGRAIAITANQIVVTGHFSGTATLDGQTGAISSPLTSAGATDILLMAFDRNGLLSRASALGAAGSDMGRAIDVDARGAIYLAGFFSRTVQFDIGNHTVPLGSVGAKDIFVLKTAAADPVQSQVVSLLQGKIARSGNGDRSSERANKRKR